VGSLTPHNSSLKLSHFLASSSARSAVSASRMLPPPLAGQPNSGGASAGFGSPTPQAAAAAAAAESWDKAKLEDDLQLKIQQQHVSADLLGEGVGRKRSRGEW